MWLKCSISLNYLILTIFEQKRENLFIQAYLCVFKFRCISHVTVALAWRKRIRYFCFHFSIERSIPFGWEIPMTTLVFSMKNAVALNALLCHSGWKEIHLLAKRMKWENNSNHRQEKRVYWYRIPLAAPPLFQVLYLNCSFKFNRLYHCHVRICKTILLSFIIIMNKFPPYVFNPFHGERERARI